MAQSLFSVGGLASGMDTNSIIDKLVQLESQPLTVLQQRQTAFQSQVSVLGNLASRLSDLDAAARALATGGTLALKATSTNTSFSAVPSSSATAGSYDVQVTRLASAQKWRSAPFAAGAVVGLAAMTLTAGGTEYPVTVKGTGTLADIADAIRSSGAPVSAAVLNDGTNTYLSITAAATGTASSFTLDAAAAQALDPTGTGAVGLAAQDASFTIDGLAFTRSSNTVADALPGTTLSLQAEGVKETLSIANDVAGTQAQLETFVDAYNTIIKAVQGQLAVTKETSRSSTLAGDSTVRGLGQALQALGSSAAGASGTIRSLADLGVKTGRDGSLTIDSTVLAAAIARDPAAVNSVFADASTGMARLTSKLVSDYGASGTGLLSLRQSGLEDQIRSMTDQAASLQTRIDAYRDGLVRQFTAMEKVVSQLKAVGNFLTSQDARNNTK